METPDESRGEVTRAEQDIVDDRSPRGSLTQHSPTQESDRIARVDRDGTVARGATTSRAAIRMAPREDQPSRVTLQLARQLRGRFDDGKPVHTAYHAPSSQTSVTAETTTVDKQVYRTEVDDLVTERVQVDDCCGVGYADRLEPSAGTACSGRFTGLITPYTETPTICQQGKFTGGSSAMEPSVITVSSKEKFAGDGVTAVISSDDQQVNELSEEALVNGKMCKSRTDGATAGRGVLRRGGGPGFYGTAPVMAYTGQPVATSGSDDQHVDSDLEVTLATTAGQDDGRPPRETTERIDGHELDIGNRAAEQEVVGYRQGPGIYGTTGHRCSILCSRKCVSFDRVVECNYETTGGYCGVISESTVKDRAICRNERLDKSKTTTCDETCEPLVNRLATDDRCCTGLPWILPLVPTDSDLESGRSGETYGPCGMHASSF